MGLHGVELVMALEEGFGVSITDAEAELCITPRVVIDTIFPKLRSGEERVCITQRGFYLLRRAVTETFGVSRSQITLSSDLRSFATAGSEQEAWGNLKTAVQARSWPALVRSQQLVALLWFLTVATFIALIVAFHWAVAAAGALLVAAAARQATRRFCTRVPGRYSRIRHLVRFAVTSDVIFWTRDQVAALVKKIVMEQLGLRDGQYREDANFVKDLGLS